MSVMESAGTIPSSISEAIAAFGDLPTLAPVAVELMRVIDDEASTMNDIASVIGRDPGLATKLLRTANSALYSQTGGVTSLERATSVLGMRTVKLLSLGFSLMSQTIGDTPFDVTLAWRRSIASSVLARLFIGRTNARLRDDAFIAGLLGNIGKIAVAECPEFADAVTECGGWPTREAERRHMSTTTDVISGRLLTMWGLPDLLAESIANTQTPENAEGNAAQIAAVLQVADDAASLILSGTEVDQSTFDRLILSAATHLGTTIDCVGDDIDEARESIDEITDVFEMERITATSAGEILAAAQSRLVQLSMSVVSDLAEEQARVERLEDDNARLADEAATDPLTGLSNRRTFDAFLEAQIASRRRDGRGGMLGLVLIDIDNFKQVNDTHGHLAGDDVLRAIGRRLANGTRRDELAARVGGEEFAVVLPEVNGAGLSMAAERIRALVDSEPIETGSGTLQITASIGGALSDRMVEDVASRLYAAADKGLYEAKETGRNRVVIASV